MTTFHKGNSAEENEKNSTDPESRDQNHTGDCQSTCWILDNQTAGRESVTTVAASRSSVITQRLKAALVICRSQDKPLQMGKAEGKGCNRNGIFLFWRWV